MTKIYSVHEEPDFIQRQRKQTLGSCITEGEDRNKTIAAAERYKSELAADAGEYGSFEDYALLVTRDDSNDTETIERIVLKWHATKDTYDGGRFDYMAGIGAIRGC